MSPYKGSIPMHRENNISPRPVSDGKTRARSVSETYGVESSPSDQLSELAYYYPEPYWLARRGLVD